MLGPHRLPCETPHAHGGVAVSGGTRWVLPATILGSSLSFIDGSVVNVALPAMRSDLAADLATLQWVVNGYMLTLASLILLGGSAGDRFGRRRVFLTGLLGFGLASLACGLAPSASWLIAARLVQGAAGALLIPTSLAMIGASYDGEARGAAIGTWAAAGALTTALGPPLGGWLVDVIGWRAIFFINLPIATIALFLGWRLPADGTTRTDRLDVSGAVLAVLSLGLLSYGLIALGEGARVVGWIAVAAGVPVVWLFLRNESRSNAPMMPLALFKNSNFSGANVLTVLLYAALSAGMFVLPFMLIEVHGYSAAAAGAAFLPLSVIMGLGSRYTGRLVEVLGARPLLIFGPVIAAAGFALLAFFGNSASYWLGFLPGLAVLSIGMTLSVAPLTATVFDSAPQRDSGAASGINNTAARSGALLAIAALGLVLGTNTAANVDQSLLPQMYSLVMSGAAVLAGLSGLTAAVTIKSRPHRGL